MRSPYLIPWLLVYLLTSCGKPATATTAATAPPSVVFILSDDQTYASLGSLGNDRIRAPNLDRLVNGGTTFTHTYNMGGWNGAICVASRAMFNSGRSIWAARQQSERWVMGDTAAFAESRARLLRAAGYP